MKKRTVLAMMLGMVMIAVLMGCGEKESVETSAPISNVEKTSNDVKKNAKNIITINVTADKGWNKDSTPLIAHIISKEKKVDFYHAVSPDKDGSKGTSTVELEEGKYTVEFVSPLNNDGSAYELQDKGKAQEITVEADSKETVKVDCPMTQVPADKVTDEMLQDIVSKTQEAVKKGDDTLKGDVGKAVLETLDQNVQNNPNASDKTKGETESTKESTESESKTAETTNQTDGNAKQADKSESKSESKATGNGGGNAQTGGSTTKAPSTPATTPTEPAKPAHQHSWKEHVATKTEWVPNIVTVPDYQTTTIAVWVCNCGAEITGSADNHMMAHILANEDSNGHDEIRTSTVQVGSHTEDHGSNVTTTYVDYYYCDCGATK